MRLVVSLLIASLFVIMLPAQDNELASGTFIKKKKSIKGAYTIRQIGDRLVLQLDETFKTKSGPDLKIVFSPKTMQQVNGKNALDGSRIIGLLKSTKGSQTYNLPADFDLTKYRSVLVHCEKYAVLWGGAPL